MILFKDTKSGTTRGSAYAEIAFWERQAAESGLYNGCQVYPVDAEGNRLPKVAAAKKCMGAVAEVYVKGRDYPEVAEVTIAEATKNTPFWNNREKAIHQVMKTAKLRALRSAFPVGAAIPTLHDVDEEDLAAAVAEYEIQETNVEVAGDVGATEADVDDVIDVECEPEAKSEQADTWGEAKAAKFLEKANAKLPPAALAELQRVLPERLKGYGVTSLADLPTKDVGAWSKWLTALYHQFKEAEVTEAEEVDDGDECEAADLADKADVAEADPEEPDAFSDEDSAVAERLFDTEQ
jgi:hypothetical protein